MRLKVSTPNVYWTPYNGFYEQVSRNSLMSTWNQIWKELCKTAVLSLLWKIHTCITNKMLHGHTCFQGCIQSAGLWLLCEVYCRSAIFSTAYDPCFNVESTLNESDCEHDIPAGPNFSASVGRSIGFLLNQASTSRKFFVRKLAGKYSQVVYQRWQLNLKHFNEKTVSYCLLPDTLWKLEVI